LEAATVRPTDEYVIDAGGSNTGIQGKGRLYDDLGGLAECHSSHMEVELGQNDRMKLV
jgi:hypothetical protein